MKLTETEKAMADGDYGSGIAKCMDMLVKFGDAMGAGKLVHIVSAHTMPKEPPELLQEMTEGVRSTCVPTTLHPFMSAFSPKNWRAMGLPRSFADKELLIHDQRKEVYLRCGFHQTYSCLPMLNGNLPFKGEYVSWIGSGAQLMANSLLGARCNRDGTVINLCSAITGRAPLYGMLLDENRYGQVLVRFEGIPVDRLNSAELGAVGYHVGALAGSRVVVMDGLPKHMGLTRIKYLLAPLAVSGSVSLCHLAGITSEAPTVERAMGGRKPESTVVVTPSDVKRSLEVFSQLHEGVQMVIFGCPHCTVEEVKQIVSALDGRRLDDNKRLWIGLGHQHYHLAALMGLVQVVEDAGGVFASSCMATIPDSPIPDDIRVIATNSFKAAHYITSLTKGKVRVVVGDMNWCLDTVTAKNRKGGDGL